MPYAVATREPARAAAFLEALAPLGLTGLAMPVTASRAVDDLRPLERALASLAGGELVALASARASELVAEQLGNLLEPGRSSGSLDGGRDGGRDDGLAARLAGVAWWAVGESSAAPLRRLGLAVSVASRASAAGLAEAVIAAAARRAAAAGGPDPARLAGRRVLLPRAEEGRDEAALALRQAGATVDELVVYRTVPAAAEEPAVQPALARWLAGEVAVAALFAPSQVAALQSLLAARGLDLSASPALFAAIGETTAAALAAAGVAHLVVAGAPTPEAMVNAVASRYPTER